MVTSAADFSDLQTKPNQTMHIYPYIQGVPINQIKLRGQIQPHNAQPEIYLGFSGIESWT